MVDHRAQIDCWSQTCIRDLHEPRVPSSQTNALACDEVADIFRLSLVRGMTISVPLKVGVSGRETRKPDQLTSLKSICKATPLLGHRLLPRLLLLSKLIAREGQPQPKAERRRPPPATCGPAAARRAPLSARCTAHPTQRSFASLGLRSGKRKTKQERKKKKKKTRGEKNGRPRKSQGPPAMPHLVATFATRST